MTGSLFGSDFTYEDFMRIQGIELSGRHEALAAREIEGIAVRGSAHYPAEDTGSGYEKVISYVTQEHCDAVRTEMYERGDRLRKVMTTDPSDLHVQKTARIPRKLKMSDERDETSTVLEVLEIEVDVPIKRKFFSSAHLERGR